MNHISPKDIKNYLSSIRIVAIKYNLDIQGNSSHILSRSLRSISINSHFAPTPRCIFDISTMHHISMACNSLPDPHLFRAIFLTVFFAFLRMLNIAPHSSINFYPCRHFLRQDVVFDHPGVHLIIKWTNTLQDY